MRLLLTMNLPYYPAHGGANKGNRYLLEGFRERGFSEEGHIEIGLVSKYSLTDVSVGELVCMHSLGFGHDYGFGCGTDLEIGAEVPQDSKERARLADAARGAQTAHAGAPRRVCFGGILGRPQT